MNVNVNVNVNVKVNFLSSQISASAYWDFIGDLKLGSRSNGQLQVSARMISMEFTQPYREELTVFRISVASLVTATCM